MLHAPGSLVTYEPQWGSDVFGMFQSIVEGRYVPWSLLVKDVPADKHQDLDFIISMLDWDDNVDPEFAKHRLCFPKPVKDEKEMADAGYSDKWVASGTPFYSAKEHSKVFPVRSVVIKDAAAYGIDSDAGRGDHGQDAR